MSRILLVSFLSVGCSTIGLKRSYAWYMSVEGTEVSIDGIEMKVIKMRDGNYDALFTGGDFSNMARFRQAGIAAVEQVSGCKVIDAVIPASARMQAVQTVIACK